MGSKLYFSGLFIIVALSHYIGGLDLVGAIIMGLGLLLMWLDK